MSYRRLKRLLGETNFELKVLVLFGTGLTVLAVSTFFLYRSQTTKLLDRTTRSTARSLASAQVLKTHWQWDVTDSRLEALISDLSIEVQPEELKDIKGQLFHAEATAAGADTRFIPTEDRDWEAWEKAMLGQKPGPQNYRHPADALADHIGRRNPK